MYIYGASSQERFNVSLKTLVKKYPKGRYYISLCVDDDIYDNTKKIRHKIREIQTIETMNVEGFKRDEKYRKWEAAEICDYNGWKIMSFTFPSDFDLNQKLILSFQILKDKENFLSSLTNPRLVISAGGYY